MSIINKLLNGTHPLSEMMKKYIATPWCKCQDGQWKSCVECVPPITTKEEQGNQSHGGDLFQHSQWSALYLTNWYMDNTNYPDLNNLLVKIISSDLLKNIIGDDKNKVLEFVQACGFFHDICKGGDNIYDMYAPDKYGKDENGKNINDSMHPEICSAVIIDPQNRYDGLLKTTLDEILNGYKDPIKARIILSLCAATHWEFGKSNFDPKYTADGYINFIVNKKNEIIQKVDATRIIEDSENILIKLCMVLSCSDVASGYNDEIDENKVNGIKISEKTHKSNGAAWTNYNFKGNHPEKIKDVLNLIDKQINVTGGKKRNIKKSKKSKKSKKCKKCKKCSKTKCKCATSRKTKSKC